MNNPKTTLAGLAGAIALTLIPSFQTGHMPSQETIMTAIILGVLGWFANDAQPPEPPIPDDHPILQKPKP